ncbi:Na+/H+ antiporter NhaC family protein [Zooshikella marina]|uniref:Na+/H+ antiporter NhaC family protein n=1 Tax=Zooshikella ganghwensis TaxID=202772 RepID=UPI001BB09EA3|nr:Na+/H+ antiporter NhaC family protein [Zooshikella ganghwensis]MBU2705604.1 Na+/H+ antiporter NhaC family protein [Zooshikella ganghwensis]
MESAYINSAWSLLVPVVAIGLAVITRQVLLSLGAGVIVGALLLTNFDPLAAVIHIAEAFKGVFWEDGVPNSWVFWQEGGPNTWNIYILLFLVVLGIITSFISLMGGSNAFAEWARQRVKTQQGSQLMTFCLGIFIFIDDYFNSLAVGNICRPITDRQQISRAKLAYMIDSTAAPVCVLTPISSWGAYIIALIGGLLVAHEVTGYTALSAFITIVPMNLYPLFALLMVLAVILLKLDIGPMRQHTENALNGQLFSTERGTPPGSIELQTDRQGKVIDLVLPVVVLIAATIYFMVSTGADALAKDGKPFSILGAFELTDVAKSLVYGGLGGLAVSVVLSVFRSLSIGDYAKGLLNGLKAMLPAIYILVFAWMLTGIIGELETGKYLAGLVKDVLNLAYLPLILFIVSGIMAFATGTSWGTFGIMLPIAGDMAGATEISMMLPMFAAVLAGSVFGDHCSPISDTTILSSTGASCHHIDHVVTQLPYALVTASVAAVGFLVLGFTDSTLMALMSSFIVFAIAVGIMKVISNKG